MGLGEAVGEELGAGDVGGEDVAAVAEEGFDLVGELLAVLGVEVGVGEDEGGVGGLRGVEFGERARPADGVAAELLEGEVDALEAARAGVVGGGAGVFVGARREDADEHDQHEDDAGEREEELFVAGERLGGGAHAVASAAAGVGVSAEASS